MKIGARSILIFLFLIGLAPLAWSQYEVEKLNLDEDVSVWFDEQLGLDQSELIAGTYQSTYLSTNSHPFFLEKHWMIGDIKYRGQEFHNIELIYNTYEDYLLLKHPTNILLATQPIRLEIQLIDWFKIKDFYFANLQWLTDKPGIYNILYEGADLSLVSKRRKKEVIESSSQPIGYKLDDAFFIQTNDQLVQVKNRRGFIKAFPALKKEIKTYIKENSLIVNFQYESSLIKVAQFCDAKINVP